METQDPVFARTSMRAYTDEAVTEEQVERLLRAAIAAPSAMNQEPWDSGLSKARSSSRRSLLPPRMRSLPLMLRLQSFPA